MIRIIECQNPADAPGLLGRSEESSPNVDKAVSEILENVRLHGDAALIRYTKEFDGADLVSFELPQSSMEAALERVQPEFADVMRTSANNIALYHSKQLRSGYAIDPQSGVVIGQRILPLERVGVYVPGGTACYPSTVLMNVIPAKLAGVEEVIVVTPPNSDGLVSDDILAAAAIAGADRIITLGGAQAIAAISYGTETVPKVDKIVGPGNIYVATAKRMVYGLVDIDMIAGPSEILIVADSSANPKFLAADLLSQAEHDALSAAIMVTPDRALADRVALEIEKQLETLPRSDIAREAIRQNSAVFIVDDVEAAVAVSNTIAPEHLELCVEDPFALLACVKHAGSVFLGHYTPEALGDYMAGPNHTLPTSGTARFSSPLCVDDFVKKSSFLYYNQSAMEQAADKVAMFAAHEGLQGHARSALYRKGGAEQ